MKKLLTVLAALVVSAQVCWGITNGPGGGGAMTCSAINRNGAVLVGTDNGGLYYRTGTSGNWSKAGNAQGITSNSVMCAAFGASPNVACVAGDGFISYTTSFPPVTAWTSLSSFTSDTSGATINISSSMDFTAAAFGSGADSCTVFLGMTDGTRNWIVYGNVRTGTFKRCPSDGLPLDSEGRIVKVIEDFNYTSGGDTHLYVLFGTDNSGGGLKAMWRTDNLHTNSLWYDIQVGPTTTGPQYPIDMAISARGDAGHPTDFVVSATTSAGSATVGSLWRYQAVEKHWAQTNPFTSNVNDLTGAVYFQDTGHGSTDGVEWVQSMTDIGCSSSEPDVSHKGLWWRPAGNDTSVWRRGFDEAGSELGWAACRQARGTFSKGVAKCLSKVYDVLGIPNGQKFYWGSRQFVSMFDSTAGYLKIQTTDHDGGSDFNSTQLDNANAATLYLNATPPAGSAISGNVWAGYYDMGLWKYSSGAWHNQNGPLADGQNGENDDLWGSSYSSENYGGNITGMVWVDGNTALVTEAGSSKGDPDSDLNGRDYDGYNYRLWRSTSAGAKDTWERYGDLPVNAGVSHNATPYTAIKVFLTSLWRNPDNGRLFVVVHMDSTHTVDGNGKPNGYVDRIYVSANDGANWIQEDTSLPTTGLFVVRSWGDTCIAGGYSGLYRRDALSGSWTAISDSVVQNISGDISSTTAKANVQESIHRHRGLGVQDIYRDPVNSALWFVVVYAETDNAKYGVFASDKHGVNHSWANFSPSGRRKQRRSVTRDSCGIVYVGSGRSYCSPNDDFTSPGLEEAVAPYGSGDWAGVYPGGVGGNLTAHTFVRANGRGDFYWIAPGDGVELYTTNCEVQGGGGCEDGCETERPNAAGRSREEQPKLPRTMFSVAEARELVAQGKLELYDVSGRRAQTFKPGVFFHLERNKAGVVITRRTVLVTR